MAALAKLQRWALLVFVRLCTAAMSTSPAVCTTAAAFDHHGCAGSGLLQQDVLRIGPSGFIRSPAVALEDSDSPSLLVDVKTTRRDEINNPHASAPAAHGAPESHGASAEPAAVAEPLEAEGPEVIEAEPAAAVIKPAMGGGAASEATAVSENAKPIVRIVPPTAYTPGTAYDPLQPASYGSWAGLRLELYLVPTLSAIHSSAYGPLPDFFEAARQTLSAAAAIPAGRVKLLSVRGEYVQFDMLQLRDSQIVEKGLEQEGSAKKTQSMLQAARHVTQPVLDLWDDHRAPDAELQIVSTGDHGPEHGAAHGPSPAAEPAAEPAGHGSPELEKAESAEPVPADAASTEAAAVPEVKQVPVSTWRAAIPPGFATIVDLEILPGWASSDPTPWSVFQLLQGEVANPYGDLGRGPLGALLRGAQLTAAGGSGAAPPRMQGAAAAQGISDVIAVACLIVTTMHLV